MALDRAQMLEDSAFDMEGEIRGEATEQFAAEPYDVVAALPPGGDPAPYAAAGATSWVVDFPGDAVSVDQVRGVIRDGPFGRGEVTRSAG